MNRSTFHMIMTLAFLCVIAIGAMTCWVADRTASWRIRETARVLLEQEVINVDRYNERIAPAGARLNGLNEAGGLHHDVEVLYSLIYGRRQYAATIDAMLAAAATLAMAVVIYRGRMLLIKPRAGSNG